MPRVRRRGKVRRWTIQEDHLEYLRMGARFDDSRAFEGEEEPFLEDAWQEVRGALLAEAKPGTRPWGWWHIDAPPDPRRRIGGTGTPVPGSGLWWGEPAAYGPDYDDDDPPVHESQVDYLRRHGLLTDEEIEALSRHTETEDHHE